MAQPRKYMNKKSQAENRMIRSIDELAEFEKFQEKIMPVLRQALEEKWSADKIWNHPVTQAMLAANAVRIGLDTNDPGKALAAITAVMDRTIGKPKEKSEVTHKIEKLKDEELNALLTTHLEDLGLSLDSDDKH